MKDYRFIKRCRKFDKGKLCRTKNPQFCQDECFVYATTHKSIRHFLSLFLKYVVVLLICILPFYYVLGPYIYSYWVGIYSPRVAGRYINYEPSAFNHYLDGTIVMYLRDTDNGELYITMLHELGHHCFKTLPDELKSEWNSLNITLYVTNYAKTNSEENFAESFTSYYHPRHLVPEPQNSFFRNYVEANCDVL